MWTTYCKAMAAYNRWMNDKTYEAAGRLSDDERKKDRGAFFKSIHGTLNHLLLADHIWLSRFEKRELPFEMKSLAQDLISEFGALRDARMEMDDAIDKWVDSLTEQDFHQDLIYRTFSNPTDRRHPLWHAVLHFFNHQTHHRGQTTAMLSAAGHDVGVTDLMWLPALEGMKQ